MCNFLLSVYSGSVQHLASYNHNVNDIEMQNI